MATAAAIVGAVATPFTGGASAAVGAAAVSAAIGAAVSGLSGVAGVVAKTEVSAATSATSTVATNAIKYAGDWDGFASSMASFDTWSGVITSGAGSLVTNSLNLATIGDNGVKVTGFSSLNVNDMQSLNSVVGGLASSGLEYGLTGKTSLNVLNIADIGINSLVNRAIGNTNAPVNASCGLLELHLDDSQGASFALGTSGTDLGIGTIASASRGIDALKTNFKINHYTKKNDLQNAAIALRTQYGFGGKTENTQLKEILKGKTELKAGSGDGNAQTVRENGKRVVYLNGYSNDMTKEEQLKLGITLGHEAYRDGVKGDELTQKIETRNAVAGHTDMMTRMLGDSMYAGTLSSIIAGDTNLQLDLIARSLGDDVFNDYVDNCYDSSADYWKLMSDGSLAYDGNGNLYDENGNLILKTDKGIQGGLAQILGITSEEACQMIDNSGFDSVPGSWNVDSNFGKSITFDSATNAGLSYGDLYDNGQHKITDYLTGQNGTLKELNPKTIYDNMVSNKTMDVKKEYQGILGGLKTALKGESKYISYEEYRDNNYITGGMPREGIDYKVGDPLNVKDGNYNLITTMFRAEGNLGTHYGIDLSAVENTKVYAMLFNDNTKASFTEELNGAGGNYTSLNLNLTYNFKGQMFNDSIIQRYMHLNGSSVPNNSLVNATTVFALSGNTGSMTTAPHLHIDISSSKQSPWLNYMSKTNGYTTYYNSNNQRTYYAPEMFLKNYKWKNENAKFYNR